MKYKTTKKDVMRRFDNVINVGYCDLQHLLTCESPEAYTTTSDGWGADIYDFGDTAIVTGYSPFGNVKPDYSFIRQFEKNAEEVKNDIPAAEWEHRKKVLGELIVKFIKTVKEEA